MIERGGGHTMIASFMYWFTYFITFTSTMTMNMKTQTPTILTAGRSVNVNQSHLFEMGFNITFYT